MFTFIFFSETAKETEEYIADKPSGSIYIMKHYPPQPFNLLQCINMHQEAAQPEMTNTLHTQIYADIKLSFTTKKKVGYFISYMKSNAKVYLKK